MPTPMTIGLFGSGSTPLAPAISLLEDLTEIADPVKFIIAASPAHWTETVVGITDFLAENDVPYELVLDEDSDVSDELTEAAAALHKVARPLAKVVALLEREEEGDKRLVVLWDDEDEAAIKAVERAVDRKILALDLTTGLEALVFGDDEPAAEETPPAATADDDDEPAEEISDEPAEDDGLDALGVRVLRNLVEQELGLTRKVVGSMDKPSCIEALREHRAVAGGVEDELATDEVEEEVDEVEEPEAPAVEPAATTPDEAQQSPTATPPTVQLAIAATGFREDQARAEALLRAVEFHSSDTEVDTVVRTAHRFKAFLTGEQVVAGRPRKDGSPAQPRVA